MRKTVIEDLKIEPVNQPPNPQTAEVHCGENSVTDGN